MPGAKRVTFKGRLAFLEKGLDFFGDVAVTVRGDDNTPALSIRW